MMLGDPFRVDNILFILSVGSRYARTHGYEQGDAFGVINYMLILSRIINILS